MRNLAHQPVISHTFQLVRMQINLGNQRMTEPIIPTRHDTQLGRFYEHDGIYKPSATNILSVVSKGEWYEKWLGNAGSYAIAKDFSTKAAERGTRVHINCEALIAGMIITTDGMPEDEVLCLMAFKEWVDAVRPKFIASELTMWHKDYPVAGTADIMCLIKNQLFLIDIKTGGHYDTHGLQLTAYGELYELIYGKRPELSVLRLYVGRGKKPTYDPKRYGYDHKGLFSAIELWKWQNPTTPKPYIEINLPETIQLDKEFINVEESKESTAPTA